MQCFASSRKFLRIRYSKKFLKMEEIFWSKALIQKFVNRWHGNALFETLVPKVVDRWHRASLFVWYPGLSIDGVGMHS